MKKGARYNLWLLLIGWTALFLLPSPVKAEQKGSRDTERPILLYYVFIQGPGSPQEESIQVDLTRRRIGAWLYYTTSPRWQPNGSYVIAWYDDLGAQVSRYSFRNHRFGNLQSPSKVFGIRGKRYNLDIGVGIWPTNAWSYDGKWVLGESGRGLERVYLPTGRRRVIVSYKWLGQGDLRYIYGLDWSADGKWIAYSLSGHDPAHRGPYDPESPYFNDPGTHYNLWLVRVNGSDRHYLGHGSRPRFSPDGRWLVCVDRFNKRFGVGIRLYDLKARPVTSRWLIRDALAACFVPHQDNVLVVLANGNLVISNLHGRILSRLMTFQQIKKHIFTDSERMFYPIGTIERVDVDW